MQERVFGPKRDEVTGGWRKLHSLALYKLYFAFLYDVHKLLCMSVCLSYVGMFHSENLRTDFDETWCEHYPTGSHSSLVLFSFLRLVLT
jgi:hypothetical protein